MKSTGNRHKIIRTPSGNHQEGLLIQTLFSCSILRLAHVRKPTGNLRETHRKPSGNRQETQRKSPGNRRDTCRKPPRRPPDTNLVQLFDIVTGTRKETYRKPSGNPQESIRKPFGHFAVCIVIACVCNSVLLHSQALSALFHPVCMP